jgi:hypothetical protein
VAVSSTSDVSLDSRRTRVEVVYWAIARDADVVPDTLARPAP